MLNNFFNKILEIWNLPLFRSPLWDFNFLGNALKEYVAAFIVFLAFIVTFKIIIKAVMGRFERTAIKTETDIDNAFIEAIRSVRSSFYFFLALWFAVAFLDIHHFIKKGMDAVLIIWISYLIINAVQALANFIAARKLKEEDQKNILPIVLSVIKGVIWGVGLLVVFSNLGINITALVAGLGIGGIAVALAAQNILGDLFSSLAIYLDRPFALGDFVIIGQDKGFVEKIGIKTTRIASIRGEEVVIPNSQVASSTIYNFKKMQRRRVSFTLGVIYDTPADKIKAIPEILKNIIEGVEDVKFDRSHFFQFGDSALLFETVYYVNFSEYNLYMDINQAVLLQIKERFEKEGIAMAYPTQTIYLGKEE